jgi:nucleoside-diphosphate kinase
MIIIKPDAFDRKLVAIILAQFEPGIKRAYTGRMHVDQCRFHYAEHVGKPFYPALVHQMTSGISLFVDVSEGWEAAREKAMIIRARYGIEGPRNLIHASDSLAASIRETDFWFKGFANDSGITRREVLSQSQPFGQELGCSVERAILPRQAGELENSP